MDGRSAEWQAARSSGPIAEAPGATSARTRPSKNTAASQFAVLFGLPLAVQFAAALLTPMGLNELDEIEKQFSLIAVYVWLPIMSNGAAKLRSNVQFGISAIEQPQC